MKFQKNKNAQKEFQFVRCVCVFLRLQDEHAVCSAINTAHQKSLQGKEEKIHSNAGNVKRIHQRQCQFQQKVSTV